jgi:rhodanese-related sulfurtransferase
MSKISPPELDARRSSGNAPYVLDIRPAQSYRREHIEGSHNVPVYDDLRRGDESELRRSLEEEGYDAATLAGGMRGWNGYQNGSVGYRLRSAIGRLLP